MNNINNPSKESNRYFGRLFTKGLLRTLIFRFLVIAILPMLIVAWLSVHKSVETFKSYRLDGLSAVAHAKYKNLNRYFESTVDNLRLQAGLENTVHFLKDLSTSFESSGKTLEAFTKSYQWALIENKYAGDLTYFLTNYSYVDLQLLDNSGNILYSFRRDIDLGTSLFNGPNAGSRYAVAAKKTLQTGATIYSDIEYYPPFNHQIASFLVQAVVDEQGNKQGVLAIHLNKEAIAAVMGEHTLGQSGETYLVGEDRLMRSNSRFQLKSSMLVTQVNTRSTREWLEHLKLGQLKDMRVFKTPYADYRNVNVLGVSLPIEFAGIKMLMLAEFDETEALFLAESLIQRVIAIIVITMILVVLFAIVSARSIARPIVELTEWARQLTLGVLSKPHIETNDNEIRQLKQAFDEMVHSMEQVRQIMQNISVGDLSQSMVPRSVDDHLVNSLNHLKESLQSVVDSTHSIAQGYYDVKIEPRSSKDHLGIALSVMTRSLQEVQLESDRQNWLKTSRAELAEVLSGDQDVLTLSNKVIAYLTQCFDAQVGLLYSVDPNANRESLLYTGAYAYENGEVINTEIPFGQGLAGQAALSQQMLQVQNLPEDYLAVNSALGRSNPSHILLFPFVGDNKVGGVIEMGKFGTFSEAQLELLEFSSATIAVAFKGCFTFKLTQQLLVESQTQSEELESNQRDLKASNETLLIQTQELKASEEELKQQSEELQVINEELQSKQQTLLEQKTILQSAEKDLKENAEKLKISSQYKSEFLANMSHELRTPLNSLLILSRMLSENKTGNMTDEQVEDATVIYDGGQELLNLIGDIMDMSKVEAGQMTMINEEVCLDDVLNNVETLFHRIAKEKSLSFSCKIDQALPKSFSSDEQRLMQILKNFLSNAFKFTSKGKVCFHVHKPSSKVAFIRADLTPDNCLSFSVSDTGIGIKQDKQQLIFEAFQQADGGTSRAYGGTGLGLSISTKMAHLLGGEIQLQSELDKGSTFILYLPIVAIDVEAIDVEAIDTNASDELFIRDDRNNLDNEHHTVLIIEDDANFARKLLKIARNANFKAIVTNKGCDGLYLAMNYSLQAIIVDHVLPDISGLKVMEQLKHMTQACNIPVHVISGLNVKQSYLNQGAKKFISKTACQDDIESIFKTLEQTRAKQKITLLLIEDDHVQQRAITRLLESKQTHLICADSAKAGFAILKAHSVDGIILDLGLVDMDGYDILKKLQKDPIWSDIPVVIHTGQNISTEQHQQLSALSMDIIIKGSESPERLLADVSLFFNSMEEKQQQQSQQNRVLPQLHDAEAMFKDRRILLVDDDMRNVFALSKQLESVGFIVSMADNGQTALDKLSEDSKKSRARESEYSPIELVIMDIMMPVMDGYEAMSRIRKMKKHADIPIIALTAKAMNEDRKKCLDAGANEYITKPIDVDKLMSILQIWLYKSYEK